VRYSFNPSWGTTMEVYTVPDDNTIEQNNFWSLDRYFFFYCQDYYESEKAKDAQKVDILDFSDEGLWYSLKQSTVPSATQTSGTSVVDFSEPVTYTLTSADGQTSEWEVTITLPDDCPPTSNCENRIFSEIALAKMASLGKTIPNERIVVRYSFNPTWGTEMQVYTVPSNEDIEQGVWWFVVRYEFFYCKDYYEQQKRQDEQITDILDYDDEGLWYSMRKSVMAMSYQDAYDDYIEVDMWEIIE